MPMFEKLFKNKKRNCTAEIGAEVSPARPSAPVPESILSNNLMIVQLAAYYTAYGDEIYKKTYLEKTEALGIPKTEAVNIFNFLGSLNCFIQGYSFFVNGIFDSCLAVYC